MSYMATSTKAKVKQGHAQQVREILEAHDLRGIELSLAEDEASWMLRLFRGPL